MKNRRQIVLLFITLLSVVFLSPPIAAEPEVDNWFDGEVQRIVEQMKGTMDEALVRQELERIIAGRAAVEVHAHELNLRLQQERQKEAFENVVEDVQRAIREGIEQAATDRELESEVPDDLSIDSIDEEPATEQAEPVAGARDLPSKPNLIFGSSNLSEEQIRSIVECINPAEERLAAYSVAVINNTSLDRQLTSSTYLTDFMGHAVPASNDERLGVRMIVNTENEEWEYVLEGPWGDVDRVRQDIRHKLLGRTLQTNAADVDQSICRITGIIEDFLEEGRGVPENVFEARRVGTQIASVRQILRRARADVWDTDTYPVDRDAPFFAEDFAPIFREASDVYTLAARAYNKGEIAEADAHIQEAARLVEDVRQMGSSIVSFRVGRHLLQTDLRAAERKLSQFVDSGEVEDEEAAEIRSLIDQCRPLHDAYDTALRDGARISAVRTGHEQLSHCVEEVQHRVESLRPAPRDDHQILWVMSLAGLLLFLSLWLYVAKTLRSSRTAETLEEMRIRQMENVAPDQPEGNEPDDDDDGWISTDGW